MRVTTKFIIAYILIPAILPIVSFLVGVYFKSVPAITIVVLYTAVYLIVLLKYGPRIIAEFVYHVG